VGVEHGADMRQAGWEQGELTARQLAERSGVAVSALPLYERQD